MPEDEMPEEIEGTGVHKEEEDTGTG